MNNIKIIIHYSGNGQKYEHYIDETGSVICGKERYAMTGSSHTAPFRMPDEGICKKCVKKFERSYEK